MILADNEKARRAALGENPADAAQRLRRAVRDHEGLAGHDPSARSAAARIPAAWRCRNRRSRQARSDTEPQKDQEPRRANWPSSTRCSASAAAVSPSPIRKSPRCRRARFSKPRPKPPSSTGEPVVPEVMVPLIATTRRIRHRQGAHRCDGGSRVEGEGRHARLSGRHHDRIAARLR